MKITNHYEYGQVTRIIIDVGPREGSPTVEFRREAEVYKVTTSISIGLDVTCTSANYVKASVDGSTVIVVAE